MGAPGGEDDDDDITAVDAKGEGPGADTTSELTAGMVARALTDEITSPRRLGDEELATSVELGQQGPGPGAAGRPPLPAQPPAPRLPWAEEPAPTDLSATAVQLPGEAAQPAGPGMAQAEEPAPVRVPPSTSEAASQAPTRVELPRANAAPAMVAPTRIEVPKGVAPPIAEAPTRLDRAIAAPTEAPTRLEAPRAGEAAGEAPTRLEVPRALAPALSLPKGEGLAAKGPVLIPRAELRRRPEPSSAPKVAPGPRSQTAMALRAARRHPMAALAIGLLVVLGVLLAANALREKPAPNAGEEPSAIRALFRW